MGLLGGAFDPIHLGHIQIAKNVLAKGLVDEVWLLPCFQHMFGKNMTEPAHRLEMCRLACTDYKHIKASSYEIDNKFDGKAIDFVNNFLKKSFSSDKYSFWFIIGMDNALKIDKWYKSEELRKSIGFIVLPRVGLKARGFNHWFERYPHMWVSKPVMEISSTQVRTWIEQYGEDGVNLAAPYIDPKVASYIREHKLYGLGDKKWNRKRNVAI